MVMAPLQLVFGNSCQARSVFAAVLVQAILRRFSSLSTESVSWSAQSSAFTEVDEKSGEVIKPRGRPALLISSTSWTGWEAKSFSSPFYLILDKPEAFGTEKAMETSTGLKLQFSFPGGKFFWQEEFGD